MVLKTIIGEICIKRKSAPDVIKKVKIKCGKNIFNWIININWNKKGNILTTK